LQLERPESATPHAGQHERLPLGDQRAIPQRPVLVLQQHDVSTVAPGRHSRVTQQHQGEQAHRLRLGGHQSHQHPGEPDRIRSQVSAADVVRTGVVDQVQHRKHGTETAR
jgi:hypothetical protein